MNFYHPRNFSLYYFEIIFQATDPDLNDTLTYYLEYETITHSDDSISAIVNPFAMNPETGELTLQFVPLSTMSGYFDFNVTVYDEGG